MILLGFLYDTLRIGFDAGDAAKGFVPHFDGTDSILLAIGILGATVMPHVIYLHSALTQNRVQAADDAERRLLLRFKRIDVSIAMTLAGLINMSMLVIAASLFHGNGPRASTRSRARTRASSELVGGGGARLRARAAGVGLRRRPASAPTPARSSCRASSPADPAGRCAAR